MSLVLFKKEGPIGHIIFNNPKQLNAIDPEMAEEFHKLIKEIRQDTELRCVILTGAGRAFCAGGKFDFILGNQIASPETNQKKMMEFYGKFLGIRDLEIPTIAAINGHAVGAGLCIAMACDLRIAADNAKLGVNFSRIGLSSGMGCLYHLPKLVGQAKAAELLFTGKIIPAEEALNIGLINQICESKSIADKALELAQSIADNAPLALRIIKKGLQLEPSRSLNELFAYESEGQAKCFPSKDLQEGISALQEKRKAKFMNQ